MRLALLAVTWPRATQGQITNGVFVPVSTNYGKSYAEWFATWEQWATSLETIHHPLTDTADISAGQSGPVWLLGNHWASYTTRTGVVPASKALLVMIASAYADNSGGPTTRGASITQNPSSMAPVMVHGVGVALWSL